MKITSHIAENAFGNALTYRMYESTNGSKNILLFLHGMGERGPIDGSKLDLLDRPITNTDGSVRNPPNTLLNLAVKGAEFPFSIVAPQVEVSYSQLKKFILPYLHLKYKTCKIIVTGLSLGGMATYELALMDEFKLIDSIAPVCGRADIRLASQYPEMDAWAFHGDKDTTVPYSQDKSFIDEYNKTHTKQIKLTTLAGVAHNAWDYAYKSDSGLYQWLLERFIDN